MFRVTKINVLYSLVIDLVALTYILFNISESIFNSLPRSFETSLMNWNLIYELSVWLFFIWNGYWKILWNFYENLVKFTGFTGGISLDMTWLINFYDQLLWASSITLIIRILGCSLTDPFWQFDSCLGWIILHSFSMDFSYLGFCFYSYIVLNIILFFLCSVFRYFGESYWKTLKHLIGSFTKFWSLNFPLLVSTFFYAIIFWFDFINVSLNLSILIVPGILP